MESNREAANQQNANTNKVERKVMERNRRNQMKLLYSELYSLLPTHHSTDPPLPVSDQIEEAIKYIKTLETKLQMDKEKKEKILERLKMSSALSDAVPTRSQNSKSPELEIKEMGSIVEVVFSRALEDQSLFYEIIPIFHEERAEIINLTYSVVEDTVMYSIHAEIEDVRYELGAKKLTERLNKLVSEWKSDEEMQAGAASSSGHGGTHPANTPTTSSGRHL